VTVHRHESTERQPPELQRLLDRLTLEPLASVTTCSVMRPLGNGPAPQRSCVLFGGQVAAQALAALGATVAPSRPVHSLDLYFLGLGHPNRRLELDFQVQACRFVHRTGYGPCGAPTDDVPRIR
jgi:acyl-CoA thioesterase